VDATRKNVGPSTRALASVARAIGRAMGAFKRVWTRKPVHRARNSNKPARVVRRRLTSICKRSQQVLDKGIHDLRKDGPEIRLTAASGLGDGYEDDEEGEVEFESLLDGNI
jgi:hypothetical protein